jgi:hypothetical protein
MKKRSTLFVLLLWIACSPSFSQEIQTIFRNPHATGGYGALTNKFTTIRGEFANIAGIYGGFFINHRFMIGLEAAGLTNDIRVPEKYNVRPGTTMSYGYGQAGLITEYVVGSNKAVHVVFNAFVGPGFTFQYRRYHSDEFDYYDDDENEHDENCFFVVEPGVQVELNIFRWMRFSPGVSYRFVNGSDAGGLTDNDLRDISYNVSLKFGKF